MSDLRYTEEQQLALGTRSTSVALDAGAGCGKTFVLTERFLSHLDPQAGGGPPADLSEVVAITFTDAAAREMRDRIRRRCRERLEASPIETRPYWRRLLRSLDGARVSTIHAFCGELVRAHAIELGIDPGYRVLDPAESALLRASAVDESIRAALVDDSKPDDETIDLAADFGLPRLKSAVSDLVDAATESGFAEWRRRSPEEAITAWREFYDSEVAPALQQSLIESHAATEVRELLDMALPKTAGFAERVTQIRQALDTLALPETSQAMLQALPRLLLGKDPDTNKMTNTAKDWPDGDTKKRFTAACKKLRELLDKEKRPTDAQSLATAAETGLRLHRIATDASQRYRESKRLQGALDQDDLLLEARRLLTDPEHEELRRRASDGVRLLLVDEFQDTDRTQVAIVRALVGEGLQEEAEDRGRLFFVGDYKQSIYRFRGAEPEVFRELREQTPRAGRLPLSINFRSQPAVIDFVNTLFSGVFGEGYTPLQPAREQVAPTPAVEFLWTPAPESTARRGAVTSERQADARALAARIRGLLQAGEPLVGNGDACRPPRPGDFAILFRALSDAPIYEEALRDAGLDYYLVGGHAFYAQQEVYDVVNLLRVVDASCDDLALAGVLRSPLFALRDETLFWLASRGSLSVGLLGGAPPAELDPAERSRVEHARRVVEGLRQAKSRMSTAALLEQAIEATAYDAALTAEFLGERKRANLEKLLEQARQSDASGGDLRAFLRRMTEFIKRPPKEALAATSPEEADVVRLMTVHRAKGLEFPIVVLPDLNRPARPEFATAAYHPRLGPLVRPPEIGSDTAVGLDLYLASERRQAGAELDRLFYVACTRAADRLILSSCLEDPAATESLKGPWLKTLAKQFDLDSGAVIDGKSQSEPLVQRVRVDQAQQTDSLNRDACVDRTKIADEAEGMPPQPMPISADPVSVESRELFTFSISRLSGKLRRATTTHSSPLEEDQADPLTLGTLVHAVIERIDTTVALSEQVEAAAEWCERLSPQHALRNAEQAAVEARGLITMFLESDRWRRMCEAPNLRREAEFLLAWPTHEDETPTAVIRGYIDAILQERKSEGLTIVDYKTNRVDAAGVPELAEEYRLQLAVYALAAERATGLRPTSLVLHFLRPGVEHVFSWDDSDRDRAIDEVDAAIATARDSWAVSVRRELTTRIA